MSKLIVNVNKLTILRKTITPPLFSPIRLFHHEFSNDPHHDKKLENLKEIPGGVQNKYQIYRDEDSSEIFDVEEEKGKQQHIQDEYTFPESTEFAGINLKRGVNGVYNIEELVDVLRQENADNIFVCTIPKEFKYVEHMCIVTGRSYRHMLAIAEYVRRVFKAKRHKYDILPRIEGEKSRDWMALDMGNIALHIFSENARNIYDLESLWSIGPEFDKEYNKPEDPLIELFKKHSAYLHDLEPKVAAE